MAVSGDTRGLYQVLGVPRTASPDEIKAAFREQAKLYHPDGGGADEERFRALRDAYEVLRDPQRRLQYDADELDAERQRDRTRWIGLGGAKPGRGTAAGGSPLAWLAYGLAAVLGLGLVVAGALAVSRGHEVERLRAELAAAATPLPPEPAADPVAFRAAIAFPPSSAELTDPLLAALNATLADLKSRIEHMQGEGWSVRVAARSPRAASADGVAVEAWETALLRAATVTEMLTQAGIPADRLSVRFLAGSGDGEQVSEEGPVELSLLCCPR